jgi:two-component system, NarL family, nitrate/nitrite response regulator NarL
MAAVVGLGTAFHSRHVLIRVFILAGVRFYREGLEQVLGRTSSIDVVGTSAYCGDAVGRIRTLSPDVALLDLAMPEGPAAVRGILQSAPSVKVVALAISEVEDEIIAWAEAGVSGYVSRDAPLTDLVATIEGVPRGEVLCSPRVAASLLSRVGALAVQRKSYAQPSLTTREVEIVRLIDQGLSNKEIARALHIALPTVKNHVHHILEKLEVHHRADAASRLVMGLARPPLIRI